MDPKFKLHERIPSITQSYSLHPSSPGLHGEQINDTAPQLGAGDSSVCSLFFFWNPGPPGHGSLTLITACSPLCAVPSGRGSKDMVQMRHFSHPYWFGTLPAVQTELRGMWKRLGYKERARYSAFIGTTVVQKSWWTHQINSLLRRDSVFLHSVPKTVSHG